MGKGDRKTAKGKRILGSNGNTRPSNSKLRVEKKQTTSSTQPEKVVKPKAAPKKATVTTAKEKTTAAKTTTPKVVKEKAAPKEKTTATKKTTKKDEA